MTRPQYIAMCLIGGLAIATFLELKRVEGKLRLMANPSPVTPASYGAI